MDIAEWSTVGVNHTTESKSPNLCPEEHYWFISLSSSVFSFVGGFLIVCLVKGFQTLTKTDLFHIKILLSLKRKCQYLVSGRTFMGKLLLSSSCLLSIASLIIYLVEATEVKQVETCGRAWVARQAIYYLDFVFNVFFLIFFTIRFIASDNKILYWLRLHSFVDLATILPSFVSIIKQRQWLGLRFMRAFRIMYIPDVLQYLGILKSVPIIRFAQLISVLLSTMMAAAGFIQLLEISGDWFADFSDSNPIPYWGCLYLVIVTMSTVGFGDVTCKTISGKIFLCVFILTTLAFIASYIPELAELIGNRKRKLKVSLQVESDMNHIVVCGNLTYRALENFLSDFLHPDRGHTRMTKVVVMNKKPLSLDVQALLKEYFTRVVHMSESMFQIESLKRVKMHEADACVIMANQKSKKPDVDDMRNIMKAISIKNYSNTRIIIQLLKPESKKYLENLPRWQKFEDKIVCISEVKQSIMAAGCMTPGISTLLANLVFTLDIKTTSKDISWFSHYCHGASMELYRTTFSQSFFGVTFEEASRICYSKLNLMLIGVSNRDKSQVYANPSKQGFFVKATSAGLFICQKEQDLQRVRDYCSKCHGLVDNVKLIKKCSCVHLDVKLGSKIDLSAILQQEIEPTTELRISPVSQKSMRIESAKEGSFSEHIVVCPGTPMEISEVKSFITQLKKVQHLKKHDIVSFLDESDQSSAEWQSFCQHQGIFLKKGSPMVWDNLRDIDIEKCKVCIVLSGSDETEDSDDEANMDSDVHSVLTTLFVRNTIKDLLSVSGDKKGIHPRAMTLTEIAHDANVLLIGKPDETRPLHLSKSFASGYVFSTSLLDALVSMIYCNPGAFSFMKALLNMDNVGCAFKSETLLLNVGDLFPSGESKIQTFEDLFLNCLEAHGILCLGLYRYFSQYCKISTEEDRFVITNPPKSLPIHPTDLIFCLVPGSIKSLIENKK